MGLALPGCRTCDGKPRERWQIGCYTRPWNEYDYRIAFDCIAEAGFRYTGILNTKARTWLVLTIDSSIDDAVKIGEELRKRGLKCLSLYGSGFPVAKSVEAGVQGLQKLIQLCAACGSSNLLLGGVGNQKLYEAYFKVVAECCDFAAANGVSLSIKPHGGLNATGAQCRELVEIVGHKNFRIWYDPGNIFYYSNGKLDPVEDAASVDGLVVGMSVKDFKLPKEVLVTPGTGLVDFRGVLDRLKRGGFTRGPLIVECLDPGDTERTVIEARKAREFLEALVGQKA